MELENIIGYMDDQENEDRFPSTPSGGPFAEESFSDSHVFGNTKENTEEDEEEDEEIEETTEEAGVGEVTETEQKEVKSQKKVSEEISTTSESTDSDPAESSFKSYYDLLNDTGLLFVNEDFEFDGTAEGLEQALLQTRENLPKEAYKAFWEKLPDEWKPALKYALSGGTDVAKYLQTFESKKLEDLNIEESIDDQKEVLKMFYKKTTKYDDSKINKFIDRLVAMGDLEEEAVQALEDLRGIEQEERLELAAQQEAANAAALKEWQDRRSALQSIIESSNSIEQERKGKVKAYLFNELKHGNNDSSTQFDMTLRTIAQNPEHLVQLADLLLDSYDSKNGFNMERFTQKNASKVVKSVKQRLEALNNNKINLQGGLSSMSGKDVN